MKQILITCLSALALTCIDSTYASEDTQEDAQVALEQTTGDEEAKADTEQDTSKIKKDKKGKKSKKAKRGKKGKKAKKARKKQVIESETVEPTAE